MSLAANFFVFLIMIIVYDAGIHFHKTTVKITNTLDGGMDLTLHCKSKNDDLGVHVLQYQGYFQFHFGPSYWGKTLFYCSFSWPGTFHWFNIYEELRDYPKCYDNCSWMVKLNGTCLMNTYARKYDCTQWKWDVLC